MQIRKEALREGYYYHIFSRSIAGYVVFNSSDDFLRMLELMKLYRYADFYYKYSRFIELDPATQATILLSVAESNNLLVEIVAYCLMPTHIHLLLKQIADEGISKYMAKILNGYSKYFNTKHNRQGPLWTGRFKSVLVENDEQLLHLTRYIHLNPTSAGLVKNPEDWPNSSYPEYVDVNCEAVGMCNKDNLFDFTPDAYKKFVLDRKQYQREISLIKSKVIEDYTG